MFDDKPLRITEFHAFVARDSRDDEGLIGMMTKNGWVPFVCADQERLDSLRTEARAIGAKTGKEIVLLRFSNREEVERIYPGDGGKDVDN